MNEPTEASIHQRGFVELWLGNYFWRHRIENLWEFEYNALHCFSSKNWQPPQQNVCVCVFSVAQCSLIVEATTTTTTTTLSRWPIISTGAHTFSYRQTTASSVKWKIHMKLSEIFFRDYLSNFDELKSLMNDINLVFSKKNWCLVLLFCFLLLRIGIPWMRFLASNWSKNTPHIVMAFGEQSSQNSFAHIHTSVQPLTQDIRDR